MGGSKKGRLQGKAEDRSQTTLAEEHRLASQLRQDLDNQNTMLMGYVPDLFSAGAEGAIGASTGNFSGLNLDERGYGGYSEIANREYEPLGWDALFEPVDSSFAGLANSGGYSRSTELQRALKGLSGGSISAPGAASVQRIPELQELVNTGYYDPVENYDELAVTGGFTPEEKDQFLRRSTAPTAAIFARLQDINTQRGGPLAGESSTRLARQASQAGAEASLAGNVNLADMVRSGRLEGMKGIERGRLAEQHGRITGAQELAANARMDAQLQAEANALELQAQALAQQGRFAEAQLLMQEAGMIQEGRLAAAGGLFGEEQLNTEREIAGLGGLERERSFGLESELAGLGGQERTYTQAIRDNLDSQELLQNYTQMGIDALNDNAILQLQNRLQSGQLGQADAQLLALLASDNKDAFDKIISTMGAAGGLLTGASAVF